MHDVTANCTWKDDAGIKVSEMWRDDSSVGWAEQMNWEVYFRGDKTDLIYGLSYITTVYAVIVPACDVRDSVVSGIKFVVRDRLNDDDGKVFGELEMEFANANGDQ